MPFDVLISPELKAAVIALHEAEREIRLDINKETRTALKPVWTEALLGHVLTRLEVRTLLPGARIAVGVRNITAHAATSKKPLRGGLIPASQWPGIEFGRGVGKPKTVTATRNGKTYTFKRASGAQFRPRTKHGYVAHPAAALVIRRAVGIWVNTIVDKFRANWEVKQ